MAEEVKLTPGWLLRDVRRAAERLEPSQHKNGIEGRRHTVSGEPSVSGGPKNQHLKKTDWSHPDRYQR
jgi:hypothetical protein